MRRKRVDYESLSFRIEVVVAEIEWARRLFGTSPRLSSLTLETANALLPPFGSHLVGWIAWR